MTFALPTEPQTLDTIDPDPLGTRLFLGGPVKIGKSTLASQWAPKTTLFLDAQNGTHLLPGEHFVAPIRCWDDFEQAVTQIAAGGHGYRTIIIDTADLIYKLADAHAAKLFGKVAAGEVEYGKATNMAEGLFRRAMGKLFGTPGLGLWFIGHMELLEDDGRKFWAPKLHPRVREYIIGEVDHVLVVEQVGNRTVIFTAKSSRYPDAGTRLPLPPDLDMDAHVLYRAMAKGIADLRAGQNGQPKPAATKKKPAAKQTAPAGDNGDKTSTDQEAVAA